MIALGAFGASVAVDQVAAFHPILLEDGAKLIRLAAWGTYFVVICTRWPTEPGTASAG